jgi:excisionase family DNA binding protein
MLTCALGRASVQAERITEIVRQEEFVNLKEARELLGVSRTKLWTLIKEGGLPVYRDPLNKRVRLVRRRDLENLRRPIKADRSE